MYGGYSSGAGGGGAVPFSSATPFSVRDILSLTEQQGACGGLEYPSHLHYLANVPYPSPSDMSPPPPPRHYTADPSSLTHLQPPSSSPRRRGAWRGWGCRGAWRGAGG
ncbi:hypothetical protein ACOMHN_009536 [Nucella lapillus]